MGILFFSSLFSLKAAWGEVKKDDDSIRESAYSIMFDSSNLVAKVNTLIEQCSKENERTCTLQSHNGALGVLSAVKFAVPPEKMKAVVFSTAKEKIFKTSCHFYHRDFSQEDVLQFDNKTEGSVTFIAHYEVNGNYFTRFAYDIQAEWMKSNNWIMEKTRLLPGVKQTKGIGGYINDMLSFTIIVPLDSNRTMRIFACWNDIGGKLPMIGEIHATYHDIMKTMNNSVKDIRDYFKTQHDNSMVAKYPAPDN